MKRLFRVYNSEINKKELKYIFTKFRKLNIIIRILIVTNAFDISVDNLDILFII